MDIKSIKVFKLPAWQFLGKNLQFVKKNHKFLKNVLH